MFMYSTLSQHGSTTKVTRFSPCLVDSSKQLGDTHLQQETNLQLDLPSLLKVDEANEDEYLVPEELLQANRAILSFFVQQSRTASLEVFLEEFKNFFVEHDPHKIPKHLSRATYHILIFNRTTDFIYLLNRCCYLFICSCLQQKQPQYIAQLIDAFEKPVALPKNAPLAPRKFRDWLVSFTYSHQYQTLKMFAPHPKDTPRHWGDRYILFTLLAQSFNPETAVEQRQASQMLYQFLKNRYKFQLVMYLMKGCDAPPDEQALPNPTLIQASTLKLIYRLVVKKKQGYPQLAAAFLAKTDRITYSSFKQMLGDYLLLPMTNPKRLKWFPDKLNQYLAGLYPQANDTSLDVSLISETANALITYLLKPENFQDPAHPFLLLMIQQEYLTISMLLLKLVLIAPSSYLHLMAALSDLLNFYRGQGREDSQWLIGLFETIQVILTLVINEGQFYGFTQVA